MLGPTGDTRVIQIHPTWRCNLRCKHCYSASGPDVKTTLAAEAVAAAVEDGARLKYNVLGISGGEPTLYRGLPEILRHARALGLVTTVTTNGMLLTDRAIERLVGAVSLIAISLDGTPESHNWMRGSPTAFRAMSSRLDGLRRFNIPFGFIFTLTQYNVHELDWVVTFALEQGAALVQVHPLESIGRARAELEMSTPDADELAWAYAEVARLMERVGEKLQIHLDVAPTKMLERHPSVAFAERSPEDPASIPLSEIVAPLVIEADGTVVPLKYGFDRSLALGNINESRLATLASAWVVDGRYREFVEVCRRTYSMIISDESRPPLINWYERVQEVSEQPSHGRLRGIDRKPSRSLKLPKFDGQGERTSRSYRG